MNKAWGICYTQINNNSLPSTKKLGLQSKICWQHFFIYEGMRGLLYLVAVILIIGWILGFFVWSAGGLIHILLVIAIIAILLAVIRRA